VNDTCPAEGLTAAVRTDPFWQTTALLAIEENPALFAPVQVDQDVVFEVKSMPLLLSTAVGNAALNRASSVICAAVATPSTEAVAEGI
jgi:hypothetical protein